ncbi:IclR family transcriptional regulator [Oceanobacillus oncorhynchi]|uniref:IclR family transcriptional regulator n=1 Tax=Oceanobacillus oncorhynchi TaxID=545501 RepID=UPI0034D4A8F5
MSTDNNRDLIQSIVKIPLVLNLFSNNSYLSLHEIHINSKLSKTSALRLCNSLVEIGFLEKFTNGNTPYYRLGIELYKLGRQFAEKIDIRDSAKGHLESISRRLGDSSYLFVERNGQAMCLDSVKGDYYIQTFTTSIGDSISFNLGGGPQAMFSFFPPSKQEAIIQSLHLTAEEEKKTRKKLEEIKRKGYAFSIGELYQNTAAIGVPIFDIDGKVAGALSVGAISSRFSEERVPLIQEVLKSAAKELSQTLGYHLEE